MPTVKHNRFLVVRKGGQKVRIPLKLKPEEPGSVYFGVRFKDGTAVFMQRAVRPAGAPPRDLAELRAYACRLTGKENAEIAAVTPACVKCARSIPGCDGGCAHSRTIKAEEAAKAQPKNPAPAPAPAKEAK